MKKQTITKFAVIVLAMMLIIASMAITVFADSTPTASVKASKTEAYRGDEITFTVEIKNATDVQAITVFPQYDYDAFEIVSGECNLTGMTCFAKEFTISEDPIDGIIKGDGLFLFVAFYPGVAIDGDDVTCSVTFTLKAKSDAAFETENISADINITHIMSDDTNYSSTPSASTSVKIKCNHNYIEVTEDTYKKSDASCTSPAIYYKSCEHCGAKGSETFNYGSTKEHSYTREVVTEAYKKSGATCTEVALYYYCCATCDKASENDTYRNGTPLDHSYTRKVITDTYKVSDADCDDAAIYYYCCETCDLKGSETFEQGEALGHSGGNATCTEQAKCDVCNEPYGSTLEHVYTDEDATDTYFKSEASCTSPKLYYKNCATCDKAGTDTFAVGEKLPHDYTENASNKYLKTGKTCTSKAVYYVSCSVCGVAGTDTFESGSEPSHSYKTSWSYNSSSHYHACSRCGDKKDVASHKPGAAATETTAQVCTVCDFIITPALGHTHNYSEELTVDEFGHWYACSGCSEKKDYADHEYENGCDTDCDTCGYERSTTHDYSSEWCNDETSHWFECSICGDKKEMNEHTAGDAATETTAQVCTECGYVIEEALGHSFGEEWEYDKDTHYHKCACGEIADAEAHKWNDGTVTKEATEDEEGSKTFECTECSYTKTESIPKLTPAADDEEPKNSAVVWIVIGSVAGVAIIGGGVFFVIKKNGKVKRNAKKESEDN